VIAKPIESIVAADIDALLSNQVPEGRTLDYKRELPGSADADKKEFLADVSSFANTVGGDLIFGIEEEGGIPLRIADLSGANLDAEQQRLDSIILAGIEPRLVYRMRAVVTSNGVPVLILRVEQSWNAPHRVVFKHHDRFYCRSSAGKYALDTGELRQAFVRSATLEESIGRFRDERIVEINSNRTPVTLASESRIVLHLVPLQALASRVRFPLSALQAVQLRLGPMSSNGWSNRITLNGVMTFTMAGASSLNYTHLYRNGIVEAVDASILNTRHEGRLVLPSIAFEQVLLQSASSYLGALKDLGVQPPIYCFITLLGAKGATMGIDAWRSGWHDMLPLNDSSVLIPESVLVDYSDGISTLLRAPIDALWNAFGFEQSPNFDSEGVWHRTR
jgi:hypothetical protein